ncbi:hypothetical protein IAD21_01919 [Abditibacteriota bacterium]|nr:hypothetical protein IAD21_01919 [Abditibacteriota bacterium]
MHPENEALRIQIADFWAQLEAQLAELPGQRREEFLLEARTHVEGMVAARRMEGLDEESAWQQSIEAFGNPREVGHALWKQWASSGHLESEGTHFPPATCSRSTGSGSPLS